jgi:hypothetical protein
MPKYPTNSWRAREALMDHESYETGGAMRAVQGSTTGWFNGNGQLPTEWAERYRADEPNTVYTVMSYRTPIAWVLTSGEVVIPDVKYSRTTSGHQGLLYALKINGPSEDHRQARAGVREAAQRERNRVQEQRSERNAEYRARRHGWTPPVETDAQRFARLSRSQIDAYVERYAPTGGMATLATEDPTATPEDRIAALEAETFKEGNGYTEAIPSGDIVQRINDALSGL